MVGGRKLVRSVQHQIRGWAACLDRRAPQGVARCQLGLGLLVPPCVPSLCVRPGLRRCALSLCVTAPSPSLPGPLVVSCPRVTLPPVPCPCGRLPVSLCPFSPACRGVLSPPLPLPLPLPFPFPVWWWWGGGGGLWGADGPCLGLGGLEPPAGGLGAVGAA